MYDTNDMDLKTEILNLTDLGFRQRAVDLKLVAGYIRKKTGEESYAKLLESLNAASFQTPDPSRYADMEWIPAEWPTIFLVGAKKVLGWKNEDFFWMGYVNFSLSAFKKIFMSIFIPPKTIIKKSAEVWSSHFSKGTMVLEKFDEEKREGMVRIYDFRKHYLQCLYMKGGFKKLIELATDSSSVTINESKCVFNGDEYHEFIFKW
jgi:hypothetical protein